MLQYECLSPAWRPVEAHGSGRTTPFCHRGHRRAVAFGDDRPHTLVFRAVRVAEQLDVAAQGRLQPTAALADLVVELLPIERGHDRGLTVCEPIVIHAGSSCRRSDQVMMSKRCRCSAVLAHHDRKRQAAALAEFLQRILGMSRRHPKRSVM